MFNALDGFRKFWYCQGTLKSVPDRCGTSKFPLSFHKHWKYQFLSKLIHSLTNYSIRWLITELSNEFMIITTFRGTQAVLIGSIEWMLSFLSVSDCNHQRRSVLVWSTTWSRISTGLCCGMSSWHTSFRRLEKRPGSTSLWKNCVTLVWIRVVCGYENNPTTCGAHTSRALVFPEMD